MATIVDYSAGVPGAVAIKSAGHVGAIRYLSPPRASWMKGKPIHRPEAEDFGKHKLDLAFVWQYGKDSSSSPPDVMRGFEGGVADARAAQKQLNEIRCPDHPVFFAVDFDISEQQWNQTAVNYFKGAGSILGVNRIGIYGHADVCSWAMGAGVIAQVSPTRYLAWQTPAWSGGVISRDTCVLYQRVLDTPSNPGPRIGGVTVDVNDILFEEWGQRPRPSSSTPQPTPPTESRVDMLAPTKRKGWRGDPLWLPSALRAFGVDLVEDPGWDEWGNGDFSTVWGVVVHHTGDNFTSTDLIRYGHSALKGLLSQVHLARNGKATLVGVGVAWHAGVGSWPGLPANNANWHTIGIEAVSNGQTPWPEAQLDAYYRICAAICWVLDVDSSRVIGHKEWGKSQGKWDPGLIDMNAFRKNVQKYIDNPPFKEDVELMTAFDKIQTKYPSRVEGSPWTGRPLDALYNADAHAFVSRANTVVIIDELKLIREDIQANTQALKKNNELMDVLSSKLGGPTD